MNNNLVSEFTMRRLSSLAARYKKANPESLIFTDSSEEETIRSFMFAGEIHIQKLLDGAP